MIQIKNFVLVQRYNIFSQDELTIRVAKLATSGYQVESSIITAAHRDLSQMIIREEEEQSKMIPPAGYTHRDWLTLVPRRDENTNN